MARALIGAGAGVNAQDNDGQTSLMYASREGHLEIARALIEAGADKTIRDKVRNSMY